MAGFSEYCNTIFRKDRIMEVCVTLGCCCALNGYENIDRNICFSWSRKREGLEDIELDSERSNVD